MDPVNAKYLFDNRLNPVRMCYGVLPYLCIFARGFIKKQTRKVRKQTEIPLVMSTTERDITERRNLKKEILDITEREREQIGRELHDGMGQILTGISVLCKGLSHGIKEA